MAPILLYTRIYDYTAERFIQQLAATGNGPATMRINSGGGDVLSGWGMIAALVEYKGKKYIKVDGYADSMAANILFYVDEVECLDVSEFTLHRAAYPEWMEADKDTMNNDRWAELTRVNNHIRAAMEAKVDVAKFEQITGVTLDRLFSLDTRIDVQLTAEQALEIGLVSKINKITPEIEAFVAKNSTEMQLAAEKIRLPKVPAKPAASTTTTAIPNNNKTRKMTLAEFKSQHPDVYNEAYNEGVTAERDRVESWLEFNDVDAEDVSKGITSGEQISRKQMSAFVKKAAGLQGLKDAADANAPDVTTPEADNKPEEEKQLQSFKDKVNEKLGLDKEGK